MPDSPSDIVGKLAEELAPLKDAPRKSKVVFEILSSFDVTRQLEHGINVLQAEQVIR